MNIKELRDNLLHTDGTVYSISNETTNILDNYSLKYRESRAVTRDGLILSYINDQRDGIEVMMDYTKTDDKLNNIYTISDIRRLEA